MEKGKILEIDMRNSNALKEAICNSPSKASPDLMDGGKNQSKEKTAITTDAKTDNYQLGTQEI